MSERCNCSYCKGIPNASIQRGCKVWNTDGTLKPRELGNVPTTCMEYAPNGGWQRLSFQIKVF